MQAIQGSAYHSSEVTMPVGSYCMPMAVADRIRQEAEETRIAHRPERSEAVYIIDWALDSGVIDDGMHGHALYLQQMFEAYNFRNRAYRGVLGDMVPTEGLISTADGIGLADAYSQLLAGTNVDAAKNVLRGLNKPQLQMLLSLLEPMPLHEFRATMTCNLVEASKERIRAAFHQFSAWRKAYREKVDEEKKRAHENNSCNHNLHR